MRRLAPALLVSFLLASFTASANAANLREGDDPPDVFGKSSTGEVIHLGDYRGRIVVISFWATWCGPCQKEIPMLMALQEQATRQKLVVLAVNWRQSRETFLEIRKLFRGKAPLVTLISDETGRAGKAYGVQGIPHMVIVGRDGRIAAVHEGYSEAGLHGILDEINSVWLNTSPDNPAGN
ncbi:MAG TPA: TlpA disulfide reductase family protein [Steroidobacteraceae bacterium]|nr:TlpA disulfide reductase family protein [Steroidobacteraceae bacterium]